MSRFKIMPPDLGEFCALLLKRENDSTQTRWDEPDARWFVYVANRLDWKVNSMNMPHVRRTVTAQFVYGEDLVEYVEVVSQGLEMNMPGDDHAEKHHQAGMAVRKRIAAFMRENGLDADDDLRDGSITELE